MPGCTNHPLVSEGGFHQGREAAAALAWPWCRTVRHHDAPHGPMPNTKFHNPTYKILQLFAAEASSINEAKTIYGATHCLHPGYVEGKNLLARGGRCQNRFRSFTGQQQLRVFVFASCIPPSASPSCVKLISQSSSLSKRSTLFSPSNSLSVSNLFVSFPTCQVKVVRFYVSCPAFSFSSSSSSSSFSFSFSSAGPQLQALYRSVPCRTRTASSGSEWSPPDFNCKR